MCVIRQKMTVSEIAFSLFLAREAKKNKHVFKKKNSFFFAHAHQSKKPSSCVSSLKSWFNQSRGSSISFSFSFCMETHLAKLTCKTGMNSNF